MPGGKVTSPNFSPVQTTRRLGAVMFQVEVRTPFLEADVLEGRGAEANEQLIEALANVAVTPVGAPRESVRLIPCEAPHARFSVSGQSATAELSTRSVHSNA